MATIKNSWFILLGCLLSAPLLAENIQPNDWYKVFTQSFMRNSPAAKDYDATLVDLPLTLGSYPLLDQPVQIAIHEVVDTNDVTLVYNESDLKKAIQNLTSSAVTQCLASTQVKKIRFGANIQISQPMDQSNHLVILKRCKAILDGAGYTLTLTDPTRQGLLLSQSQRIEIRNLTIQYDYPTEYVSPAFWGRVESFKQNNSTSIRVVRFQGPALPPDPESLYLFASFDSSQSDWTNKFNGVARAFLCGPKTAGEAGCASGLNTFLTPTGADGTILPKGVYYSAAIKNFDVGESVISLQKRNGYRTTIAINGLSSQDIILNRVNILSSPSMAIRAFGGRGLWIKNCKIQRDPSNPKTGMVSARADGIHIAGLSGDVILQNNVVTDQGDDGLNIRGLEIGIESYKTATSTIHLENHGEKLAIMEVGDILALVRDDMTVVGFVSIVSRSGATAVVKDYGPSNGVLAAIGQPAARAFVVTKSSQRYLIQNNTFRNNHGRGMVLHAPNGRVTGNTTQNNAYSGIFLSVNTLAFQEGPGPTNSIVDHNTLDHTNNPKKIGTYAPAALMAFVESRPGLARSLPYLGRIKVNDNVFRNVRGPAIGVANTQGLKFSGNSFQDVNYKAADIQPNGIWQPNGTIFIQGSTNLFFDQIKKNVCTSNCKAPLIYSAPQ